MKKNVLKSLSLMFFACMTLSASAADLDGVTYQGIAKMPGQPVDLWTTVDINGSELKYNLADMATFSGNVTTKDVAGKLTVSGSLQPGDAPITLTSSDGGSSFEGKFTLRGTPLSTWLLRVPSELTPATQSTQELIDIVGNGNGYTSFVLVAMNGGMSCVTADFSLDKASGAWKITCDSEKLQQIFENLHGEYSIDGANITFTNSLGRSFSGTIYDNGNYIKSSLGSAGGVNLSLVLIR